MEIKFENTNYDTAPVGNVAYGNVVTFNGSVYSKVDKRKTGQYASPR